MVMRSIMSATRVATALTRHLRICKVMQLPRIGKYVPFIFYLRESSNSKGSCGKLHHGQTFAGLGIENEIMVDTTGEYVLWMFNERPTNHKPSASNDTKILRSHMAILE